MDRLTRIDLDAAYGRRVAVIEAENLGWQRAVGWRANECLRLRERIAELEGLRAAEEYANAKLRRRVREAEAENARLREMWSEEHDKAVALDERCKFLAEQVESLRYLVAETGGEDADKKEA